MTSRTDQTRAATWTHRAITVSIGAASWAPGMTKPGQLVDTADAALYQSKEGGRNRVTAGAFDPAAPSKAK